MVVGENIFGGNSYATTADLRVFRHLWSRSNAPCSSILYGYSHLHRRQFGQVWGPTAPSPRSRRKISLPEGTFLDLRLSHGKIRIILRCNPWAVGWSTEGTCLVQKSQYNIGFQLTTKERQRALAVICCIRISMREMDSAAPPALWTSLCWHGTDNWTL